jgi:hypothetical protein
MDDVRQFYRELLDVLKALICLVLLTMRASEGCQSLVSSVSRQREVEPELSFGAASLLIETDDF